MSYTTVKSSHVPLYGVGGVGSDTLNPAWLLVGALVIGSVLYSSKQKPLRANKRRGARKPRRSSHRRSSRR